jgi:hypothetical protein
LIFVLVDEHDLEADSLKSAHVLKQQCISNVRSGPRVQHWSDHKLCQYINFVQKVFEPAITEEAEQLIMTYYQYLRQNPRVSQDRKSVRMLESLIRTTEAHARLLMKSEASVYDAVCVIVLMEHTLLTCLFGAEVPPRVVFESADEYLEAKTAVYYRLGLDADEPGNDCLNGEINKRDTSPSPIRRLEQSMLYAGRDLSGSDLDLSFNFQSSQQELSFQRPSQMFGKFFQLKPVTKQAPICNNEVIQEEDDSSQSSLQLSAFQGLKLESESDSPDLSDFEDLVHCLNRERPSMSKPSDGPGQPDKREAMLKKFDFGKK